jgi:hypothetical protein
MSSSLIKIEMDKLNNSNLTTLEEFKEKNYGERGKKKRDELEAGYNGFKGGELTQKANDLS